MHDNNNACWVICEFLKASIRWFFESIRAIWMFVRRFAYFLKHWFDRFIQLIWELSNTNVLSATRKFLQASIRQSVHGTQMLVKRFRNFLKHRCDVSISNPYERPTYYTNPSIFYRPCSGALLLISIFNATNFASSIFCREFFIFNFPRFKLRLLCFIIFRFQRSRIKTPSFIFDHVSSISELSKSKLNVQSSIFRDVHSIFNILIRFLSMNVLCSFHSRWFHILSFMFVFRFVFHLPASRFSPSAFHDPSSVSSLPFPIFHLSAFDHGYFVSYFPDSMMRHYIFSLFDLLFLIFSCSLLPIREISFPT